MATNFGYLGNTQDIAGIGGLVCQLTAEAALLYGDAVFSSSSKKANKSVTAGDRLKRIGIVVPDPFETVVRAAQLVGTSAAATGGKVYVCHTGIAFGIVGAGALTAGMQLMFSAATAGRLIAATPTTDAGKIIGVALEDVATAGAAIRVLISLC